MHAVGVWRAWRGCDEADPPQPGEPARHHPEFVAHDAAAIARWQLAAPAARKDHPTLGNARLYEKSRELYESDISKTGLAMTGLDRRRRRPTQTAAPATRRFVRDERTNHMVAAPAGGDAAPGPDG